MTLGAEYARLESLLADALRAEDPVAAFQRVGEDEGLTDELRVALGSADPEGVRIASLLVARLRFERVMQGSREAGNWFERDPRAFTAAFRSYHRDTAPRSLLARDEGDAFAFWADQHGHGAELHARARDSRHR